MEFLSGRKEGRVFHTKFGSMLERRGGLGRELCTAKSHLWMDNAVIGVTDQVSGPKFWRNRADGQAFEGDLTALWEGVRERA